MAEEAILMREDVVCLHCGKHAVYHLPIDGVLAWRMGTCIQDALPDLPAEDREFLISKTCPRCWNKMFGSTEE